MNTKEITINGKTYPVVFNMKTILGYEQISGKSFFGEDFSKMGERLALIAAGSYTKGQFVRLFLSDSSNPAMVVAGAKTLQLHVSMSLEDATTKDTPGTWQVQEPTGLSYDISTNALVASNETITSAVGGQTLATIMDFYESSTLLYWQIANVSGDNQRTKGSVIVSGQARIGSIAVNAANRQVATYDTQLSGYGDYTVGA